MNGRFEARYADRTRRERKPREEAKGPLDADTRVALYAN